MAMNFQRVDRRSNPLRSLPPHRMERELQRIGLSVVALGGDQSGQKDVSEPIRVDRVEIVVGEVEFESPAEVLDPALELTAAQHGDRRGNLLETSL